MGATDHEIYKQRGRMNIQIGLLLGAFVIIVMIATIAKLSTSPEVTKNMAENAPAEAGQ